MTDDERDPTPREVYDNVLALLHREEADPDGDKAWARGARFMRDRADAVIAALDAAPRSVELDRLEAWAACVRRLIAVAPIDAVKKETGVRGGHTTPDERRKIREAALRVVDGWLARDRAALSPYTTPPSEPTTI